MGNALAKSATELRETAFIRTYLRTFDGAGSAKAVGYAVAGASVRASELLTRPTVQEAITKALERGFGVSKGAIAEELAAIAFMDPGDYASWDNTGVRVTDSKLLTKRQRLAVASVEDRSVILEKDGERIIKRDVRVKFADKLGAIEKLAKVLGLLKDREGQEAGNSVTFVIEGLGENQRATVTQQAKPRQIEARAIDVTPPDPAGAAKLVTD
jgi:hypothetical protein